MTTKLFKQDISKRLNQETVVLTWKEGYKIKSATFRNAGCQERANKKARFLEAHGAQIVSITHCKAGGRNEGS